MPEAFCFESGEARWPRSPRGSPYDVTPQPEVLVEQMQAVLDKYDNIEDDDTSVVTEAVCTACSNQMYLARRNMLRHVAVSLVL